MANAQKAMYDLRVTASGLDEGIARFDSPTLLCLLDHAQSYSVLDAASSIEELGLDVDIGFDSKRLGQLVQSDEG